MKLTVLTENTTGRQDLTAEHGLSLYLETDSHKVLFDMGQSDAFARNAEKMGIDLSQVDMAVLSHGHYDHGGGLAEFLRINQKAPIYIHADAFGAYYHGREKYIGLAPSLQGHPRLVPVRGTTQLAPGITLYDCNDQSWRSDNCGLMQKTEAGFVPDGFLHEHYLQIAEGRKRILISGCSHKGICNIAKHFRSDVLVGGFHLNKMEDTQKLTVIAEELLGTGSVFYTGHCTGSLQFDCLKAHMDGALNALSTGLRIEI